jgi:hypothetical protein
MLILERLKVKNWNTANLEGTTFSDSAHEQRAREAIRTGVNPRR